MSSSDIGYLLNSAARQLRLRFASRLGEVGLRPQQAAALMAIGRSSDARMTPRQLAEAIDMDAPTTSGLLDRLERDGWISTAPNPRDRRSYFVALTDKAAGVLPQVLGSARTVSDEAMSRFTVDEARELERLLRRLCDHDVE